MTGFNISFPEKYYVGIQGGKDLSKIDFPLGFATPWGTDAAFAKRKETVDNWVGNQKYNYQTREYEIVNPDYEPTVFNNVAIEGFQLEKVVSRYQTNNKMYRINDPRGFTLEIDTYNLCDLMLNCVIDHGQLVGKFLWGRQDGKNYLTRLDHPAYQELLEEKVSRTTLQPGDLIRLGSDKSKYIYVGRFYSIDIQRSDKYVNLFTGLIEEGYIEPYYYNRPQVKTHERKSFARYVRDTKSWMVFQDVELNNDGKIRYKLVRSVSKPTILAENQIFSDPPIQEFYNFNGYFKDTCMLFTNKQDMLTYRLSSNIKEILEKAGSYYARNDYELLNEDGTQNLNNLHSGAEI